ncbi:MAG: dicarboxylate/amino acid:cation symporter [Planctomycetes bacterium]|nr:dicarboxylate/amino acid:cation symporter [Planctomycetota bacterium]
MSLHTKILLGLLLGAACGVTANLAAPPPSPPVEAVALVGGVSAGGAFPAGIPWQAVREASLPPPGTVLAWVLRYIMEPVGQIFLRLLFMTVIPLVFASLAVGVAKLGNMGSLGRIGVRTFAYFILTMTCAVAIGLLLVNTFRPGEAIPRSTRDTLLAQYAEEAGKKTAAPVSFGIDTFVSIIPRNPVQAAADMHMLGVIFFALMFGIGLTHIDPERARLALQVLEAVGDVMVVILNFAMRLAPYGVFALIFSVTARFGFDLLRPLGLYVVIVLLGLAVQMFIVLSILVWTLSRIRPLEFFKRIRDVLVTAFSTSSSNATLPTSLRVTETELGVPRHICGFVLPLGATMNMNGTALFEGVTVMFLAQVFGVSLDLGSQIIIVVLSVLTAVGAAGVPGGSIPLLVMVLAYAGVPASGLALILGVDRLLDMCRTTLNVVGDITAATFIARSEGYALASRAETRAETM